MSFDIFLQRFHEGDGADADADAARALLEPHLALIDGYVRLQVGEAQAARVYDCRSCGPCGE